MHYQNLFLILTSPLNPQGKRKNGAIVNEGDKLTKEQKVALIEQNRKEFGLP